MFFKLTDDTKLRKASHLQKEISLKKYLMTLRDKWVN